MKKPCNTIAFMVWICSNMLSTARETLQYKFFSEEETVILKCVGGANTASWIGPSQNSSNTSPVVAVDMLGKYKIWITIVYTSVRQINPDIPNFRRLKVVDMDGNGDCDLQISNASASDEGFYRCEIYPVEGTLLTKQYILQLKNMPKVMINHDEEVAVLEGANKTLCCDIDSNANISFIFWSKEGKGTTSNINSSCLFFKYLYRQDRGNYTCFAGNEIGNGSFETSLTVYYHSSVHLEYTNFPIKERTRVVQCKGDGVPNNITYFRLEHLSDFNEHIRYLDVSSDGIAKLPSTIESKRYQDTGFYLYNASNGVSDEKGNMFQYDQAYLVSAGYLKQRYRKRMVTTPTDQTAERNSDESSHYIEIVDDNNVQAILHEHNNQMISADCRLVVENRNMSMVSREQHLESNNDSNTLDHTIVTSDDEINASEHLDDGYERPYTTLVAHIYAEDEHGYSSTITSSINDNSTTLQNAT